MTTPLAEKPPLTTSTATPAGTDQNSGAIRAMFGEITPTYDRLNILFSATIDRRWRKLAARELTRGLRPCARILDVATGTGDLANAVLKAAEGATGGPGHGPGHGTKVGPNVVGADFTRPMLDEAAKKYGQGPFAWVEADGLKLPFAEGSFDGCCIAFGLRNMEDKKAGLAEMRRILRPGGRCVVLEFAQPGNAVVGALYDFYSKQIMPRVGRWVSGSDAYGYLTSSIREYWSPEKTASVMHEVGFGEVTFKRLTGGIAAIHVGVVETR